MTELYTDVVGSLAAPWPAAYDRVITVACPNCGAASFELCVQPTGVTRRMPCVARVTS